MKLFNANKGKIEDIKVVTTNGILYVDKVTEVELNALGYYKIVYESKPNPYYYAATPITGLVGTVYTIGYTSVPKDLDEVKARMLKDLKETFTTLSVRPRVDTSLGYAVDGSRDDLQNFQIGRDLGFPTIVDADDNEHAATLDDYNTIILAIQVKGAELFNTKRTKKAEINALTTVDECILYEAAPYEALVDVMVEGTFEPTGAQDLVTLYKNNVKEW